MVGEPTTANAEKQQHLPVGTPTVRACAGFPVRYTYGQILENIRAKIVEQYGEREDRRHKELYLELGIPRDQWKRKFDGETKFNFREISALSETFEAPPGWPYISWDAADSNKRAMELLEKMAPGSTPPPEHPTPESAAPSARPERRKRGGHK
jgi:hypothetical protein